jgi:hypothetical protein
MTRLRAMLPQLLHMQAVSITRPGDSAYGKQRPLLSTELIVVAAVIIDSCVNTNARLVCIILTCL